MTARHEHSLRANLHELHANSASWRLQLRLLLLPGEQCLSDIALRLNLLLLAMFICDTDDRQIFNCFFTGPVFLLLPLILL